MVIDARKRILVVDDSWDICESVAALFTGFSGMVEVIRCTRPAEALAILRRERFDLVLCDQRMPGVTGLELLAWAREVAPNAARVLMTAYAEMDGTPEHFLRAKPDAILTKPFDASETLLLLTDFLNERKADVARHRAAAYDRLAMARDGRIPIRTA